VQSTEINKIFPKPGSVTPISWIVSNKSDKPWPTLPLIMNVTTGETQ